jgi:hypothetical protein
VAGFAGEGALKAERKAGGGGGRRDLDVTSTHGLAASSRFSCLIAERLNGQITD